MRVCSMGNRLRVSLLVSGEQHALAFTEQQYVVAERYTGNVRLINGIYSIVTVLLNAFE